MTTIVPGVISRRLNSVALTANVGNVVDLYVRGVATGNVLVTDAQNKVVTSNVTTTSLTHLNGLTGPIQPQLDAKANVSDISSLLSGTLTTNVLTVGNALILSGAGWTANSVLVINGTGNVVTTNVSTTELQYLDGLTQPIAQSLAAKANVITGAATTIAYADLTADRALQSTGAGKVGVSTTTATELGYLSGVTSNVQTQLNARANLSGATFSGPVALSGQTASRVAVFDANKALANAATTLEELNYLSGVTSSIQTQLNAKANLSDISGTLTTNVLTVGNSLVLSGAGWTANSVLVINGTGNVVTTNVSTTELQYLDGLTQPIAQSLAEKANVITGAASTIAYADLTANRALISDASGKVAVSSTVTTTELEYLDGVTGPIQTQLNARANLTGATFSGPVALSGQTASRVAVFDANKALANAATTLEELNYLSGVTSSIQTQLNAKANLGGPVTFTDSVTINGNLTVLGNVTAINTEQLVVEDPLLVLNTDRISGTTGLYLQQQGGANVAVVYQGGNVALFNTPSDPTSGSLTVGSYASLAAGSAALQGSLTIVPPPASNGYMSSMSTSFTTAGTTHTLPASIIDAANAGTGVFAGQLMIWVTNSKLDATNKTGYATVSLLKTPPDFDVVPISVHRNVNLSQFDIGKSTSGTDVIVLTDSDCTVSWKFEGSTIR